MVALALTDQKSPSTAAEKSDGFASRVYAARKALGLISASVMAAS
jgi:hypothetical protein